MSVREHCATRKQTGITMSDALEETPQRTGRNTHVHTRASRRLCEEGLVQFGDDTEGRRRASL